MAQQINTLILQKVGTASTADIFGFNPVDSAQTNSKDKNPIEAAQK
jgi:hypothetical protein